MSPRTFFVGILALVCGISASVGVNRLRKPTAAKPEVVAVPVAAVAVKRGDKVTDAMLVDRQWPKSLVPSGAITKRDQIVGKVARVPLVKGEPFFTGKVGDSPRFSGLVKDGMRAYAILTPNDSSLVAGLVEPGDKVDVLLTDDSEKEVTGGGITSVLMSNIEVMAIGQIIDGTESREKNSRKMRSVTLAVSPEQANMLQMAQKTGTLGLALRSDKDDSMSKILAVTTKELLRLADLIPIPPPQKQEVAKVVTVPQPPAPPKQPSQIAVRTLRGSLRSTMVMRASEATGGAYLESNPFEVAPSLPPSGQGSTE